MSHPSRVRGLKYWYIVKINLKVVVAPFTGAWIEIVFQIGELDGGEIIKSHPSRVRGLKSSVAG